LLKPIAAKEFGQFGEGFMGISMGVEVAITVPGEEKPCYGLTVSAVTDGSPAAKAELQVGDVILSIDGHRWHEPQSTIDMKNGLSAKIRAAGAGNKPRFGIWRGKQWIEVEVLLTRRPTDLELLPMKLLANGGVRMDEEELNKLMEEEKNSGAFFSEWLERQLATPPAK
jgi:C-terminal processing protease CtpA/Prc